MKNVRRTALRSSLFCATPLALAVVGGCEPSISIRELEVAATASGAAVAHRQLSATDVAETNRIESHWVNGADGTTSFWDVATGLGPSARLVDAGAGAEEGGLPSAAITILLSDEGFVDASLEIHGDPHSDGGPHDRWDLILTGSTDVGSLAPVSFGGFRAAAVTKQGLQEYEIDRESGAVGLGPLYAKLGSALGSGGSFGDTPGLNGGDMVQKLGVTPDCAPGGNADRCKTEVVLDGKLVEGSQSVGRPVDVWSDATGHLSFARLFDRTLVLEGSFGFRVELPANDGCTAAGFDLDGTPLAVRVTPDGAELLEGTKTGFVPTAWSEPRIVDADLDGDGWFDTVCAIAPYRGDVWVAWVERDASTGEHVNIEFRKVVEKATSGLKDTIKTQI